MGQGAVIHNTFVIERNYAADAERVFAAFADPAKKRLWCVEGEHHDVELFEMDFAVGGRERAQLRMRPGTAMAGALFESNAIYQDIVPGRRVLFAATMSMNGQRISASLCTVELMPSDGGTEMVFTHQAAFFEGADGPVMREGGWRKLFARLESEVLSERVEMSRSS